MFSRAWQKLHVFPRLAPGACFPAFGTGYMFSHTWHWLHVFPHLALVTCFPALGTGCMFSRSWHRLHVFPLSSDWFTELFEVVAIPDVFLFLFYDSHWKLLFLILRQITRYKKLHVLLLLQAVNALDNLLSSSVSFACLSFMRRYARSLK